MAIWAWVVVGVGAVLLAVAAVVLSVIGWRAYRRRMLLRLLVRAEAVQAAGGALRDTVLRLADGPTEELQIFIEDPESVERRAMAEVRSRAGILYDELDRMALPKSLIPVAEALADAAYATYEQAGCVGDADNSSDALDHLAGIKLEKVRTYSLKARTLVAGACDVCGLDDTAVYGGGLYL